MVVFVFLLYSHIAAIPCPAVWLQDLPLARQLVGYAVSTQSLLHTKTLSAFLTCRCSVARGMPCSRAARFFDMLPIKTARTACDKFSADHSPRFTTFLCRSLSLDRFPCTDDLQTNEQHCMLKIN